MLTELRALLLADPAITALVDQRITQVSRPQGDRLPAVVIHLIDRGTVYTMDGPDALRLGRVQIDCLSLSWPEARDIADAVEARLSGYRGGIFRGVFHDATRGGQQGGTNEVERPFRFNADFLIRYADN